MAFSEFEPGHKTTWSVHSGDHDNDEGYVAVVCAGCDFVKSYPSFNVVSAINASAEHKQLILDTIKKNEKKETPVPEETGTDEEDLTMSGHYLDWTPDKFDANDPSRVFKGECGLCGFSRTYEGAQTEEDYLLARAGTSHLHEQWVREVFDAPEFVPEPKITKKQRIANLEAELVKKDEDIATVRHAKDELREANIRLRSELQEVSLNYKKNLEKPEFNPIDDEMANLVLQNAMLRSNYIDEYSVNDFKIIDVVEKLEESGYGIRKIR